VRDLAFVGFLATLLAFGLRRPFLFVLAYAYVDIVSPQRLSYYLLNSIPVSMIVAALAVAGWAVSEDKRQLRVPFRQWLILILLAYVGYTTVHADFPLEAMEKWNWVSKALIWAFLLPLALTTRLRIEAYLLMMILSASAIIIVGGIKTAVSGGGYGTLVMFIDNNSGLFEGSTISTVAIAIIPVILWLAKYGTVFPPDWRVRIFAAALIFACLLIPVGTAARTGVICIGVLGILMLRHTKRRLIYMILVGLAGLAVIPLLPQSFTNRTATISGYQADESASTRLAIWAWTLEYAQDHPFGGGFEAYRQNKLKVQTVRVQSDGTLERAETAQVEDAGRAYHSSYFEMLGEQGYPGLILFLLIHGIGLFRMEILRRRYKGSEEQPWLSPLATALQSAHIIYLVGSLFIGIAFQPFIYMLVGTQIGLDTLIRKRERLGQKRPFVKPKPAADTPALQPSQT
jgi:probable O-glycosylation ligase (exosortase A-associated)